MNETLLADGRITLSDVARKFPCYDPPRAAPADPDALLSLLRATLAGRDVRMSINAIIDMTSALRDSALTADQRDWVDVIRGSCDHVLGVINGIRKSLQDRGR